MYHNTVFYHFFLQIYKKIIKSHICVLVSKFQLILSIKKIYMHSITTVTQPFKYKKTLFTNVSHGVSATIVFFTKCEKIVRDVKIKQKIFVLLLKHFTKIIAQNILYKIFFTLALLKNIL